MPRNPNNHCPQRSNRGRNFGFADLTPDQIEEAKKQFAPRVLVGKGYDPDANNARFYAWLFDPNATAPLSAAVPEITT